MDNHSQDTTPEILTSYQDRLLRIRNDANRGFCAANNQGISRATGELILTLNSDVILAPDYIAVLQQFLRDHPDIAMVQGKLLRMDGTTIDSAGLALSAAKRWYDIGSGKPDAARFKRSREIFGACAAAALYRRDALEAAREPTGYFDERFFFLGEDFDLAWRIRKQGGRAWYVPQAQARHFRQSSSPVAAYKQYLSWRNRYYTLAKNATAFDLARMVPGLFWYDVPRLVYFLGTNPYATEALREVGECLRKQGAWQAEAADENA